MKKVLILCVIALAAVGCKSKKNQAQPINQNDVEVIVPCTGVGFYSDGNAFRASGEGFSNSMTTAKDKALQVARTRLATEIESTLKAVIDNYASSYEMGMDEESKSKYEGLSRTVVSRELRGVITICEKMMKTPEGAFRAYICIELVGDKMLEGINNSVKNDDKLRIDYEYEKFKKTFEEEMNKLGK